MLRDPGRAAVCRGQPALSCGLPLKDPACPLASFILPLGHIAAVHSGQPPAAQSRTERPQIGLERGSGEECERVMGQLHWDIK